MIIEFLIVPIGMAIQLLFLFKRDLLNEKKYEKLIWIGATFLFVFGYFLSINYAKDIKTLPFLMVPLMSYAIFRSMLWTYKKIFKTLPVDTFWSMNLKLMRSSIFNIIFWVIGLLIPIFISFEIIK